MKRILLFLFFVTACLALFQLYFSSQFPYTHDGENHLARFANYKIALREGQFPPRFAPNLLNGFGYPAFNYNYPLANILSLPFSILNIHYELTFKLLVVGSILFGAIGLYAWLRALKISKESSFFASLGWVVSPYIINLVYFRGNIGEVMAYALLPWMLYGIERSKTKSIFPLTVILSLLFLSHNIVALLSIPLFIFFVLIRASDKVAHIKKSLLALLWSIGLTLWFWLPALFEMKYVILSSAASLSDFTNHFPTARELLWGPTSFGYSYVGSVDSLSFSIGALTLLTLCLAPLFLKKNDNKLLYGSSFGITLLLCLLQLSVSTPFWEAFKKLQFIQFPWRLGIFIPVLIAPLISLVVTKSKLSKNIYIVFLFFQIISISRLTPISYFHRAEIEYDLYASTTSTQNENLPKTFTFEYFEQNNLTNTSPEPSILNGEATFVVAHWSGSKRSYIVNAISDSLIVEPTAHFPGWETIITQGNKSEKVEYAQSEAIAGRLAYSLPAGEYEVTSRFTQNTPARLIGNSVSLLSLVGLLIFTRKRHE